MTDEILSLQDKIKCLEKENQYLKSLLDQAGISYHASDKMKNMNLFDPDQGARIIPREITDHDANLFFSMFWAARMCLPNVLSKNLWERFIITRNAIIFIRQAAQE